MYIVRQNLVKHYKRVIMNEEWRWNTNGEVFEGAIFYNKRKIVKYLDIMYLLFESGTWDTV